MLEKFKMSLVETPAVIEKRQQRQAIIAARAARDVERGEERLRKEREQVKRAELEAKALADAERAAAELSARDAAEKRHKRRLSKRNRKRLAMRVTRRGRQPRSNGGGVTSPIWLQGKTGRPRNGPPKLW